MDALTSLSPQSHVSHLGAEVQQAMNPALLFLLLFRVDGGLMEPGDQFLDRWPLVVDVRALRGSQVVRQRFHTPLIAGSTPAPATNSET